MDTAEQTLRPSAKCGVLFRNIGQRRSCSMDQQLAQVLVSSLADPHESWLAAGRRLTRNQAQPCRKIATMFESLGLANGCNQSRRNRHADTRNRYQSPSIFVLLRPAYELRIKFSDSPIKFLPLGANVGNQRLEEIARAKALDCDTIEIWFADEARIGQKNKITRRWAKRGTRPSAPRDQRTASTYIFGAVCPKRGKGAALILPACNTEAMNLHLAEIAAAVEPAAHAVLLVDQAGWHMSTRLVVPANVTIITLPPKCPELNPVENVWQFMRDNWLSNRIFKSYDDLVDHCCEAWNKLVDQPWRIMSLGLRQWAHEF